MSLGKPSPPFEFNLCGALNMNSITPETNIVFNLPESGLVKLEIYNIKGQKIKEFTVTLSGVEELYL